jgi:hypothetical protein
VPTQFTRDFLEAQQEAIQAQKAEQMAARDAELAEVAEYLAEMDKLGIVASAGDVKP